MQQGSPARTAHTDANRDWGPARGAEEAGGYRLSRALSFSLSPQDLPCSGAQGLKLKSRGSRGCETSRIWAGQCCSRYGHASAAVRGAPSAEAVDDAAGLGWWWWGVQGPRVCPRGCTMG